MFREYQRWLPYISDIFLMICDSENGDLRMLPYPGAITDQPRITMQILGTIQAVYREVASERVQKMTAKASRKKGLR